MDIMDIYDVWDIVFTSIGLLLVAVATETGVNDLLYVAVPLLSAGGVGLYFRFRPWYCSQCSQFLGRGSKPGRCGRCGSNRLTNRDPDSRGGK